MATPSPSPSAPLLSPPVKEQSERATTRSGSMTSQANVIEISQGEASHVQAQRHHEENKDKSRWQDGGRTEDADAGKIDQRPEAAALAEDEEDDADDLVAISGQETMLQEGAYRQVGGSEVRKVERSKLIRKVGINILLIASWFFFSTLMNLYNSWLFSKKRMNFAYPLFTTAMHMVVQFILSSVLIFACRRSNRIIPRRRNGKKARPSVQDYTTKVMPCALATAMDIGLSNLSLQTITLTFYTMCKSSNLAFVLMFAFLFGLEKLRLSLIGIITLITAGVIMMVAAETEFVLEGAVEVLTASAMGGLRWALMQILLKRKAMGMSNPIATMFYLSPMMGLFMFIASLAIEHWREMLNSPFFSNAGSGFHTIVLLLFPGLIVFCMNLCEFTLIQRTSVMTLSVAGIFKEILTIMISSTVFGDELTPINVTGLCIAILGIAFYNYYKYRLMMRKVDEGGSANGSGGHGDDDDDGSEVDDDDEGPESRYTELEGGEVSGKLNGGPTIRGHGLRATFASEGSTFEQSGGSAAYGPVGEEDESLISETERERRRKREEEADMDGWKSSGFQKTGNGYDDGRGYDSDATA